VVKLIQNFVFVIQGIYSVNIWQYTVAGEKTMSNSFFFIVFHQLQTINNIRNYTN
jgi:hypothetical protein